MLYVTVFVTDTDVFQLKIYRRMLQQFSFHKAANK